MKKFILSIIGGLIWIIFIPPYMVIMLAVCLKFWASCFFKLVSGKAFNKRDGMIGENYVQFRND